MSKAFKQPGGVIEDVKLCFLFSPLIEPSKWLTACFDPAEMGRSGMDPMFMSVLAFYIF